jgi:hypothetical protein
MLSRMQAQTRFLPTCRSLNTGTVTNCDESLRIVTNVTAELMVSAEMMVTHSILHFC